MADAGEDDASGTDSESGSDGETPCAAEASSAAASKKAAAATSMHESDDSSDFDPLPKGMANAIARKLSRTSSSGSHPKRTQPGTGISEMDDMNDMDGDGEPVKRKKRPAGKGKETAAQRLARLHPELEGVWEDMAEPAAPPAIEQPANVLLDLLPFQREGVAWMINQETDTAFKGGILADEMGMGKTIQTISLLATHRTEAPTLVVCPAVALVQWKSEIETHTPPKLFSILQYHGQTRPRDEELLSQYDIVLTTYATVENEWRRQQSGFKRKGETVKQSSTLHAVQWGRIVLDEAHNVKDRSCSTARAVFGLQAIYKWSLTGTPLQNRVGELYSLVKFLQIDPFSHYFCRQCECKSLHWRFSDHKTCDDCGHRGMSHFCWWNKVILRPIQTFGGEGLGLEAFNKLGRLLKQIMMRRTKTERGAELGLPPRLVYVRRDLFSAAEADFYQALYSDAKTTFQHFVDEGTVLNKYAHIFQLLTRMRQAVNHPWLVTHRADDIAGVDVCGICHDEAEEGIAAACGHIFCREDMRAYLASSYVGETGNVCPVCFQPLSIDLTQPALPPVKAEVNKKHNIVNKLDLDHWRSSTKVEAVLEELAMLREKDQTIKSIIFSQFTTFLDLLHWRLNRAGYRCVRLDGRMSPAQRAAVIDAFQTKPEIGVFLISLKAGGVALNLTAASRVFFCDCWWNPQAESQAMDRIHRLGQTRPVEVKRIIIEDSIESRILQLQRQKELVFQSAVGADDKALARLTREDMSYLFAI